MPVNTETVTIAPDIAAGLLDSNPRNRALNQSRISSYAADMRDGRWILNGETIVIANDGTLIDGQHRLRACLEAGVPFLTVLVRGVDDPLAQDTTDHGQSRTAGQQLALRGERLAGELSGSLRFRRQLIQWIEGKPQGMTVYSTIDALRDLEAHPGIRESVSLGKTVASGLSRYSARIAAPLHYEFARIDADAPEDADEFFSLYHDSDLVSPRRTAPADHPITQLRAAVLRERSSRTSSHVDPRWLAAMTVKAWNLYRSGKVVRQLRWRQGGSAPETFPRPV